VDQFRREPRTGWGPWRGVQEGTSLAAGGVIADGPWLPPSLGTVVAPGARFADARADAQEPEVEEVGCPVGVPPRQLGWLDVGGEDNATR